MSVQWVGEWWGAQPTSPNLGRVDCDHQILADSASGGSFTLPGVARVRVTSFRPVTPGQSGDPWPIRRQDFFFLRRPPGTLASPTDHVVHVV